MVKFLQYPIDISCMQLLTLRSALNEKDLDLIELREQHVALVVSWDACHSLMTVKLSAVRNGQSQKINCHACLTVTFTRVKDELGAGPGLKGPGDLAA